MCGLQPVIAICCDVAPVCQVMVRNFLRLQLLQNPRYKGDVSCVSVHIKSQISCCQHKYWSSSCDISMDTHYGGGRLSGRHIINGRRPSQRPTYDDGSDYYSQQPGYPSQDSRRRPESSSRTSNRRSVPIEAILEELDSIVQDAMTFYRDFHQDFLHDIQGIESYASDDLLSMILMTKANASTNPCIQHRRESVRSTTMHTSAGSDQNFHTVKRTLIEGMRRALTEISYCKPGHDDTPSLVRSQISKTHKAIGPALQIRLISISNLNTLATQLEMLSVFLKRHGAGHGQARSSYDEGRDSGGYRGGDMQDDGNGDEHGDWEGGP